MVSLSVAAILASVLFPSEIVQELKPDAFQTDVSETSATGKASKVVQFLPLATTNV